MRQLFYVFMMHFCFLLESIHDKFSTNYTSFYPSLKWEILYTSRKNKRRNDMNIYKIKKQYENKLFKLKNVVGIDIGNKIVGGVDTKHKCIRIYVEKKLPCSKISVGDLIPQVVGSSVKTDVIEIGKIKIFGFTERMRPAKGGISIGHHKITAGTLGCLVRDKESKETLILSNNHVLAQSNKAKIGDKIIQPGSYDKGTVKNDLIAHLERFIKIHTGSSFWWRKKESNIVDCAVAKPINESLVSSQIMRIGIPKGIIQVEENMQLQKSGRTTGYTRGKVIATDMTVKVNYGTFIATFKHQIMAGAMSAGGDSGSLVLDLNKNAVGLLFAGSEKVTIINPINNVLTLLDVELITE